MGEAVLRGRVPAFAFTAAVFYLHMDISTSNAISISALIFFGSTIFVAIKARNSSHWMLPSPPSSISSTAFAIWAERGGMRRRARV